ncbi:MAG: rhamnulokinase [Candidatus Aminicenantes bacterium]|nr:MAG: rhamnulokinase [Candidatus Aminicenantes bacterium]
MKTPAYLAFDLGAESGRTVLGWLEDGRLNIKELNRFPNGMVSIRGHLYWNIFHLFEEMKKGMKLCVSEGEARPESIAVDTWGVDFGLLAPDGTILGLPYAYRDSRTEGAMEELFKKITRERIYQLTGIQFVQLNTLFQLFAMKRDQPQLLDFASDLLFIPDIFNYLMTGEKKTEFTFATTSQLYNPRKKEWEDELFEALGVSSSIMQEIIPPGTIMGKLDRKICQETGLDQVPVCAVASHDTGSAVAAVPAESEGWAYISSGTWSLMGIETKDPIINDQTLDLNFTNEGGVEGTFRFLKNITGLWLLQECRRAWAGERNYGYDELIDAAKSASSFRSIIQPDWKGFLNPEDMPLAVREFCQKTGQPVPDSPADYVRSILESLALKYRLVLDQLKKIYPHPIHRVHIIGGGAQNRLLCQFTANATGLPVIAGPVEATAIGNIMVQALSLGFIDSDKDMREIIKESFELVKYKPEKTPEWESAYERFQNITGA